MGSGVLNCSPLVGLRDQLPTSGEQVSLRARSSLSEYQREQLVECFEQGMGYRTAAKALGVSKYAVRTLRWPSARSRRHGPRSKPVGSGHRSPSERRRIPSWVYLSIWACPVWRCGSCRLGPDPQTANPRHWGCFPASSHQHEPAILDGHAHSVGSAHRWPDHRPTAGSNDKQSRSGRPLMERYRAGRPAGWVLLVTVAANSHTAAPPMVRWRGGCDEDARTGPAWTHRLGNARPTASQWARKPGTGQQPRQWACPHRRQAGQRSNDASESELR